MVKFNITDDVKNEILAELGYNESADESQKNRIEKYIEAGMSYLNRIAGAKIDFSKDIFAFTLLKTYCRYANSCAIEFFNENNLADLQSLHFDYNLKGASKNEND